MVQKPFAISVIAAVVVAGILILSVLAVISSSSQAFAQAKPTSLSLDTSPCCERKTLDSTVNQNFTGQLTSEGSGVGGATIHIIGSAAGFWSGTTSELGMYGVSVRLGPGTYHIHAHYAGDSEHGSSDSKTITFMVTH
jgi:hypothetical protein